MKTQIPGELWRALYDIQGEAQQAAESERPCYTPEECWERIVDKLPQPYRSAPDLLEALEAVQQFMIPGMNWTDEVGEQLKSMTRAAIAKARGKDQ